MSDKLLIKKNDGGMVYFISKEAVISCYKSDGKWVCVLKSRKKDKSGKRKNLGRAKSKSRQDAYNQMKKREKEVQTFKHMGDKNALKLVKLAYLYSEAEDKIREKEINRLIQLVYKRYELDKEIKNQ